MCWTIRAFELRLRDGLGCLSVQMCAVGEGVTPFCAVQCVVRSAGSVRFTACEMMKCFVKVLGNAPG